MFNYIFYRAKNQWKLLLLLWISFLIANAFIISGPTYLGWVKKMIYEDGLNNTPPTTRNVSITTGSQPLIRDSYEKNNSIIDDLANQHLEELFLEKSSLIQSTEYFWGIDNPNNSRTASKLTFVSMSNVEKFIDTQYDLNVNSKNPIKVIGPKKRLEQLGLNIGDTIEANSIKGTKNLDSGLNETKKSRKEFWGIFFCWAVFWARIPPFLCSSSRRHLPSYYHLHLQSGHDQCLCQMKHKSTTKNHHHKLPFR